MAYRPLRKKQETEQKAPLSDDDRLEILYARQSTTGQVLKNTESMKLQLSMAGEDTIILIEGLQEEIGHIKGVSAQKQIEELQESRRIKGVSAQKRLDQKPKLQKAIKLIKEAKAQGRGSTLKVYSTSRLFRSKSRVDVETFIDICREFDVHIKTSYRTYDFNRPLEDEMFRMECNYNRMYVEQQVGSMHDANRQQAQRGEYPGGALKVGYIVDRTKNSPTEGRYIPYEPHAEVSARLYKRFRELGGRFNLLASEIAKIPVLFPPFESNVDIRNVRQLRIKKVCKLHGKSCNCKQDDCEIAGYHLTKKGLFFLLTAPEYVGYWRFDGVVLTDANGQPLINHTAIVPFDDWLYAFNHLSFTTLTGEDNSERTSTRTWTTTKKADTTSLLEGLLVSPLGSVHSSAGFYRVYEKQSDKLHYTNTLVVPILWIDTLFHTRLDMWLLEHTLYGHDFLDEQLESIKANNAEALISVDEQIANYRKDIENRDAYIKMVGAALNKENALKLNAAMEEDQKHLAELVAKKDAANKEVTGIGEIVERIKRMTGVGESGLESTEDSRRFIRLVCERIELNEYSGHILTLTIKWRAPFAQTDVCYIYRTEAGRQHWTDTDEQVLQTLYPEADRAEIMQAMPKRSWQSIKAHASVLGIERRTHVNALGNHRDHMSLLDVQMMREHAHEFLPVLKEQPFVAMWVYGILDQPC
jgi:Resolvase, N terminal domain